jgi:hypothetical protein
MLLGPIGGTGSWVNGRHLVDKNWRPMDITMHIQVIRLDARFKVFAVVKIKSRASGL